MGISWRSFCSNQWNEKQWFRHIYTFEFEPINYGMRNGKHNKCAEMHFQAGQMMVQSPAWCLYYSTYNFMKLTLCTPIWSLYSYLFWGFILDLYKISSRFCWGNPLKKFLSYDKCLFLTDLNWPQQKKNHRKKMLRVFFSIGNSFRFGSSIVIPHTSGKINNEYNVNKDAAKSCCVFRVLKHMAKQESKKQYKNRFFEMFKVLFCRGSTLFFSPPLFRLLWKPMSQHIFGIDWNCNLCVRA